jgi:hypothetical protein
VSELIWLRIVRISTIPVAMVLGLSQSPYGRDDRPRTPQVDLQTLLLDISPDTTSSDCRTVSRAQQDSAICESSRSVEARLTNKFPVHADHCFRILASISARLRVRQCQITFRTTCGTLS